MMLFDPFVWRALFAGLILAVTAAPLGCFVVWKRMAYFGDALSHSALLGIALGLAANVPLQLGIVAISALFAALIYGLQRRKTISNDTLLGILAHAMLAYGLVSIAMMPDVRIDLHSVLFGDILSVSETDLYWIAGGAAVVLGILAFHWQKLLLATLSEDLARAEGYRTNRLQALLLLCLTLTVALAIQVVGILLVTSMLIIPAATARIFAKSPEGMAGFAGLIGILAVSGGLCLSLTVDIPTGPSIVATLATLFFVAALVGSFKRI
jgi:zinc transport system permease protein